MGEGNTSILTELDGVKKVWHIISISDNELVLVTGSKNEKWTFKVK